MKIYQLKTAKDFIKDSFVKEQNLTVEKLIQLYAEDVSKRFATECVNKALGNKMEVPNALYERIDLIYKSID